MEARNLPNRAQKAPRGSQDAPKTEKEDRPNINHPRLVPRRRILSEKVANMAPSWLPKSKQNRRKIDAKINQKTMHLGFDFWKDFGGFLEAKWKHVGTKIDQKSMPTPNNDFLKKLCFSWGKTMILRVQGVEVGSQNLLKNYKKLKPKMDRLLASIFDGFWLVLGAKLGWKIEPRAIKNRLKNASKKQRKKMRFGSPWVVIRRTRRLRAGILGPPNYQFLKKATHHSPHTIST